MRHTALPVISRYSLTVLALAIRFHNLNRKGTDQNALEVFSMGTMFVAAVSLLKISVAISLLAWWLTKSVSHQKFDSIQILFWTKCPWYQLGRGWIWSESCLLTLTLNDSWIWLMKMTHDLPPWRSRISRKAFRVFTSSNFRSTGRRSAT